MTNLKEKVRLHGQITKGLTDLYSEKNERYGDCFSKVYAEMGMQSVTIRLTDKLTRLKAITGNAQIGVGDESVVDTLRDMANYAIMAIMEIDSQEDPKGTNPGTAEGEVKEEYTTMIQELMEYSKKELEQILVKLGGKPPKKTTKEKLAFHIETTYGEKEVYGVIDELFTDEVETDEEGEA